MSNLDGIIAWFDDRVLRYEHGDKEAVLRRWRTLDADTLETQIQGSITNLQTDRKTFERAFKKYFGIPLSSITDFAPHAV